MRSFQPNSKMDPFECHTFEEAVDHETGFTGSRFQGNYTLINNLQMVCKLIYNYKLEFKRVPRKTAQITKPS